ncbi:hypothetical protein AC1031_000558 [Aphanomyces cochlioides]|nr:hypothetical protein AC1031_000558 [Aphanomyces cochlioides]
MKVALLSACLVGAAYAQCGGKGFTGPTTCVSGYTARLKTNGNSGSNPTSAPSTAKPTNPTPKPSSSSSPTVVPSNAPTTAKPSTGGSFCDLPKAPKWSSTGVLANPKNGWVSLKDFTNVVYNGKHIVYGSVYTGK